jgi:3-isopropylmalate/(R)-2-methylmalate dehydratase small subunit
VTVLQIYPQFIRHTGIAAPFLQPDVEGELIAPLGPELHDLHEVHIDRGSVDLRPHPHDGSWPGQHAFHGFRYRLDGSENPEFVLNREPYRRASILIAGRNFGLGSLQSFAVIRLMQCGMRVVIAPSFGPVFHDDCFDFGLLPVTLEERVLERLVDAVTASPEVEMTVDLVTQRVERPGTDPISFEIDPRRRVNLLRGSDSTLDERLQHADSAAAMRSRDQRARPWLYNNNNNGGTGNR